MPVNNLERIGDKLLEDFGHLINVPINVPDLPTDILEWLRKARPIIDGRKQDFRAGPMWIPIYLDNHPDLMVVAGRQVWKSSYCTNILTKQATGHHHSEVQYVNHDGPSLSAFSNQRLRQGTFGDNKLLAMYPVHGTGSVSKVELQNASVIYMDTDHGEYKHVEGKSLQLCVLDEAQYQDIQFLSKLEKTFAYTRGRLRVLGIGGEAGSPYERRWLQTDQRQWFYDNSNWRDKLEFNSEGMVIDDYMYDVLRGNWIAQVPKHTEYRGYHMPQTIMPFIALTIEDARTKYKIPIKYSIEYQQLHEPQSIVQTHVFARFNKALRRPITHEMFYACCNPYKKLSFMEPSDIENLRNQYEGKVLVTQGIDWGSGPSASLTVSCIMIKWDLGDIHPPLYQIAEIEYRPREDQRKQTRYMIDKFNRFQCDFGVADLGYGTEKVKTIQEGGADVDTGERFAGLGTDKFLGCNTMSSTVMPFQFHQEKEDAHGSQVPQVRVDKTSIIQNFIDMLDRKVHHPDYINGESGFRPQLIIPFEDDTKILSQPMNLLEDFTSITRKDIAKIEDVEVVDPRQHPRKEFNHPPDSVMAILYSIIASDNYDSSQWHWISA